MNSSRLIFDPVFPLPVIAVITALFFAFCVWKEINRKQRFIVLRIIALTVVFASVLGLLLRPSVREEKSSSNSILLTQGFNSLKADSIVKKYPDLKIFRTENAEAYASSQVLSEESQLLKIGTGIQFILGAGLSKDELDLIEKKNFKFIQGSVPVGVTSLFKESEIRVNQVSKMDGTFYAKETGQLRITGPAGTEDSVSIRKGATQFSLSIRPKQTGLFVYSLEFNDGKTSLKEKLPIEVLNEQKLKILILQKFPTAEVRYLKNFLAEKSHSIAVRYQTSKTNFKYEYANMANTKVDRIRPELASSLDLVLIDNSVIQELSSAEKKVLEVAIHSGLGMIILELPEKEKTAGQFLPVITKTIAIDTVHFHPSPSKTYVLPAQPITILSEPSIHALAMHRERVMSGYRYSGAGRVGFQLLRETYRVRLEGNVDDYSSLWTPLIEQTSRVHNTTFKISIKNQFPCYKGESFTPHIISSGAKPDLYDGNYPLPLSEDVLIDDEWTGTSWAGDAGWHKLIIKQDSTAHNYYVSEKGEWSALRFTNQIKNNTLEQRTSDVAIKQAMIFDIKEISPLLFYLTFLFAFGFLWLAPKI